MNLDVLLNFWNTTNYVIYVFTFKYLPEILLHFMEQSLDFSKLFRSVPKPHKNLFQGTSVLSALQNSTVKGSYP